MKTIMIAACLIALLSSASSASEACGENKWIDSMVDNKIRVLVLINAGEPDPTWDIAADIDLAYVKKSLTNLRSARKPDWPNLGRRGFLLVNEGISDLPKEIQVFKGIIRITNGEKIDYYEDQHGLEKWLERQAKTHGIRFI